MTYTVYIPDVAHGPAAYTQRAFTSIKELARWAMDEALAEPPRADVIELDTLVKAARELIPSVASFVHKEIPDATAVEKMLQPMAALVHEKMKENMGLKDLLDDLAKVGQAPVEETAPAAEEEPPVWDLDTDAWFATDDTLDQAFKGPVGERDWKSVAKMFCDKLVETGFEKFDVKKEEMCEDGVKRMVHNPNHLVMRSDLAIGLQLAIEHAAVVGADLFPEVPVRWELLPPEFKEQCQAYIQKMNPLEVFLWPSNPLTTGVYQIVRFFTDGKRHETWVHANMASGPFSLGADTAIKLISEWWSGVRASDAIRELMIKAVTVRTYASEGGDIGGAEFLTAYTGHVTKLELPAAFVEWATRGTTHRHCKKALGELGVGQVRTAAGQRYKSLRPITKESLMTDTFSFNYDLPAMNGVAAVWPAPLPEAGVPETIKILTNKGEISVAIPNVYDGVQGFATYQGTPSPTGMVTSA